jgi:hypothetical protein
MHGYLASGIFKMLGLQSSATCPQHNPPPNTAKINADFISPPLNNNGRGIPAAVVRSG